LTGFSTRIAREGVSLDDCPFRVAAIGAAERSRPVWQKLSDGGRSSFLALGRCPQIPRIESTQGKEEIVMETPSELDRLGDEIAEMSAHLEAATSRLLDRIREFDAREGWNTGFRSCAAWLSWRVGLDAGAARERVRVARALGALPRLREALGRGQISYAKVRAVTRVATPETE
jgi:hypothetical protein